MGRVLGGKYHLIDVLGRGGFGAVYRALQAPVGRMVAVKVIGGRHADDMEDLRARFMREARAIASLRHHATVALHDFGEDADVLYMVLEVVEGETLRDVLKREGRLGVGRAIHIARQILETLQEAHTLGLVHRDLKPSNVMLSLTPFGDDKVRVLDFGIAKIVEAERSDGIETSKGMVYGSPAYMAPEQAQARAEPRSDLYAVGVMLYEMLTGERPFGGESDLQIILAHLRFPVPDGLERAGVPVAVADVIHRALAKDPADRVASAADMAVALGQAVADVSGRASVAPLPVAVPVALPVTEEDELAGTTTTLTPTPSTGSAMYGEALTALLLPEQPVRPPPRRRRWPWIALAAIVAGGATFVVLGPTGERADVGAPIQVDVAPPTLAAPSPEERAAVAVEAGRLEEAEAALRELLRHASPEDRARLAGDARFRPLHGRPGLEALAPAPVDAGVRRPRRAGPGGPGRRAPGGDAAAPGGAARPTPDPAPRPVERPAEAPGAPDPPRGGRTRPKAPATDGWL
ncbi:MAG: serine/threonine-protein kinase [bacterium]